MTSLHYTHDGENALTQTWRPCSVDGGIGELEGYGRERVKQMCRYRCVNLMSSNTPGSSRSVAYAALPQMCAVSMDLKALN